MGHRVRLLVAVTVALGGTCFAAGADQSRAVNWEKGRQQRRIQTELSAKLISWLSDANGLAGEQCDRLVDSLLALPEPSIKAHFIAAQATYIRGKPHKAISILEDLLSKNPDRPSGVMQFPVRVMARFWIGTIARHSGDMTKAKQVCQTILESLEGVRGKNNLTMICNLYLAEIESLHLKRNDVALAGLETIQQIKKPAGHWGVQYEVYKDWAAYEYTRISEGKDQAARQLAPYPAMESGLPVAGTQLKLCGIMSVIGLYRPEHIRAGIISRTLLERFRNRISPIDWSLTTFVCGFGHHGEGQRAQKEGLYPEAEKHYLEAEKYYSELFEDDSFFSPVAGFYLAHRKKAQGKTAEANDILRQVRAKYPGYDAAVAEIQESWNRNKRENMKDD